MAKAASSCGASDPLAWPPRERSGQALWTRREPPAASLSSRRPGRADPPKAAATAAPPAREAAGRAGASGPRPPLRPPIRPEKDRTVLLLRAGGRLRGGAACRRRLLWPRRRRRRPAALPRQPQQRQLLERLCRQAPGCGSQQGCGMRASRSAAGAARLSGKLSAPQGWRQFIQPRGVLTCKQAVQRLRVFLQISQNRLAGGRIQFLHLNADLICLRRFDVSIRFSFNHPGSISSLSPSAGPAVSIARTSLHSIRLAVCLQA